MWWFFGLVCLCLIGWGVCSTHRVLYPERRLLSPPATLPPHTIHTISAPDHARFEVWVLTPPSLRASLLLCHGYYANRYQVMDLAQGLYDRGYEVMLVELRGHGERPGPCTLGIKEAEDALALLEWCRTRQGAKPLPMGVLGLSMGAVVACHAALRAPDVRAVVVDSPYSRLFPVLARAIRQRYHLPAFPWAWITWGCLHVALKRWLASVDPAALAPRLCQPLLAIQGGEDRRVVPLLGREFYQRWAGPKERWFEPKVAHVGMFARHPEEYCDRVASFFDRALAR